jgi:hypothetical protein
VIHKSLSWQLQLLALLLDVAAASQQYLGDVKQLAPG